jgi:uncharacterized protein YukE
MSSQLDVTTANETTGAGVIDSWHSFASSIESIKSAHGADKAAVGVEIGISGVSAVLDTVAFALDPLAKLISAGLGWLIEHVQFLRWPLDQIAGNPDQIQKLADSLHTIGQNLRNTATDLDSALKTDITKWKGQAADQFTATMNGHKTHIDDAGHSVDTVGYVVETTMALIAAVRGLFRDIITTVLGDIIATMLVALAAAVFTFGASIAVGVTKCVIEGTVQVASMMAKLAKVAALAGRTAGRIRQLTGMTKGETSAAGHELGPVSAAPHASGSGAGAHGEPPTPNAVAGTSAGHTGGAPGTSTTTPPTPHNPDPSAAPSSGTDAAASAGGSSAVPHPNDGGAPSTPPSSATDPAASAGGSSAVPHPNDSGAPSGSGTSSSSADHAPTPPPSAHGDPSASSTGGNPNAGDYSAQQGVLDEYHNNPSSSGDGASVHGNSGGNPNAGDYSAQQGVLDEYHNNPSNSEPSGSGSTSTSGVEQPPTPSGSSAGASGGDPAASAGHGTPNEQPPTTPTDNAHGTPPEGTPPANTPAEGAGAHTPPENPPPAAPKSMLSNQDISLLKKHEDWLKNNFAQSQAKAKFVDNWVKKNAPDSYPLVKAMSDAKSSKNWVGWVDKSAVQVDKQLTNIQVQAEAAWQQSNDQWRAQHPDPAAGAVPTSASSA